ncbi:hypothetical protein [Enterococcus sp. UD-01]|jgi:hypothetical protein|uniref:hypothetical protein n=1 Tax=Enterococcus sp. UD-01 TaxID=3373911 RepID=UPI0038365083
MAASNEKIEVLLGYLSEIHNKSLSLYDLITSQPRTDETRILLNINEVFTYYHSIRIFYYSQDELFTADVQPFFTSFEDFYFELKQVFLHDDNNTALLYNKLSSMKDSFEQLTNDFNVL